MEKKYRNGVNVNSLHQRKVLHYSNSSSIPHLPPILQKDIPTRSCNSSPILQKRTQIDRSTRSFDFESKQPKSTLLPKLERSHFETTSVFCSTVKKDTSKSLLSDFHSRYDPLDRKPAFANDQNFGFISKQDTSLSSSILGMRRKKKDRLSSYKCSANTVIDDEISQLEQRIGFDAISTTNTTTVKDMRGRMICSGDVYNEGVSSLITMIDEDEKTKNKAAKDLEKGSENENATKKLSSRSTALRERFLKALDKHFFNEFVNMKVGRRMAICEELEKDISGDGKTSLTGLREHLRLQDVLDSWVL